MDIKELTVYQYRSYLDNIVEVEKLFNGKPATDGNSGETEEEKTAVEDLLQICKEHKIRTPYG